MIPHDLLSLRELISYETDLKKKEKKKKHILNPASTSLNLVNPKFQKPRKKAPSVIFFLKKKNNKSQLL